MSGIEGPTHGALGGIVGGAAATFGGLAIAERVMRNGPHLSGNIAPALMLGAVGGLVGVGLSNIMGDSLLTDAAAVGGVAALGGAMMMGGGRASVARGAAIMGIAALGGVALARVLD
jgi:hypothetical protein